MDPIPRLLNKIKIIDNCWIWTGGLRHGYGVISINNKSSSIHRFIYEYYHGQICPDLVIDHLCKNRACCNPIHLEQVTQKVNVTRGNTGKNKGCSNYNTFKTHCIHGHEFNELNTYFKKNGERDCRVCNKLRARKLRKVLVN
jgi:hypothetical protein